MILPTVILGLLVLISAPDVAAAQSLLIGGAQASRASDYGYFGLIDPVWGGRLGEGFFLAPIVGVSRYSFIQSNTRFTGLQPAASLGLGYAFSIAGLKTNLSLAAGYANTSLSPYVPTNAVHGGKAFLEPSLWALAPIEPRLSVVVNGGYLTGLRSYWFTSYAQYRIAPQVTLGPELDMGGGPNYRNRMFGLRLGAKVAEQLELSGTLGEITNIPGSYHPYIGLGVTLPLR
jgi:hypothetical protein